MPDAEVPLDAGRGQREGVGDQVGGAGREPVADGQQMVDVRRQQVVPAALSGGVGHRLHEQRTGVMAIGVLQGRVRGRVEVPLDGGEVRQPAGLHVSPHRSYGVHRLLLGKQVNR